MTNQEIQTAANDYAKSSIEDMREALERLAHARDCDGEEINGEPCSHVDDAEWHDEDSTRAVIDERPLSVQVRSDWYSPGSEKIEAAEYEILLTTGGPAARIIGDLDTGSPTSARFEYQDWFTPWTDAHLSVEDRDTLLEYAQQFYFGE